MPTYYVSTTGNDSTGDGSIDHPWATPVFGASRLTQSGDALMIRGGTYNIPTTNSNKTAAIHPVADNTTIQAYIGEAVALVGGTGGTNYGVAPTNGVIGNASHSNVTISGFTVQGVVVMESGDNVLVENCDISAGGDSWSGIAQGEVIWLENCTNSRIYNNKLHDNSVQSNVTNNSLIMAYTNYGITVENNEIYNSVGAGVNFKDTIVNSVIRNNFIHDNAYSGIWGPNQANTFMGYTHPQDISIYQNIIINNNTANHDEHGGVTFLGRTTNLKTYNNTFCNNYKTDFNGWTGSTGDASFFNNISYAPRTYHLSWPYSGSTFLLNYLDFNDYYRTSSPSWRYKGTNYTSFSAWQTEAQVLLAGAESSSITSNPLFINASGNLNTPADFKRSSYTANGRGGSYPSVIGAYATGSENIGVISSSPTVYYSPNFLLQSGGTYYTIQGG